MKSSNLSLILSAALGAAALDTALALAPWAEHWREAAPVLRLVPYTLIATIAGALVAAAAGWVLAARSGGRFTRSQTIAAACGGYLAAFAVLRWFGPPDSALLQTPNLWKPALAGAVGLAVGFVALGRPRVEAAMRVAGLALCGGAVLLWAAVYRLELPLTQTSGALVLAAATALIGMALIGAALGRVSIRTMAGATALVTATLALTGVWAGSWLSSYFMAVERPPAQSVADRPKIILISVDTLRRDALSIYNPRAETPHMDSLGADATVYDSAYSSQSWTLPSVASFLTGLPARTMELTGGNWRLPEAVTTLAERLSGDGYRTAAAVDNYWLRHQAGLSRGFQEYAAFPHDLRSLGARIETRMRPRLTTQLTDLAVRWMDRRRDESFFFWIHYFDPHNPYDAPADLTPAGRAPPGAMFPYDSVDFQGDWNRRNRRGESPEAASAELIDWYRELYRSEVRYVDREIGKLLRFLRSADIYDDALIVLVSDHGEQFWEHEKFGHGYSVADHTVRVPLLVKQPGGRGAGRVSTPVSTTRVFDDVLDVAGVGGEEACKRPASVGGGPVLIKSEVSEGVVDAIVDGRTKAIRPEGGGELKAYDLDADPGEHRPLDLSEERAAELTALLDMRLHEAAELRACLGLVEEAPEAMDPSLIERLKGLGYLQ